MIDINTALTVGAMALGFIGQTVYEQGKRKEGFERMEKSTNERFDSAEKRFDTLLLDGKGLVKDVGDIRVHLATLNGRVGTVEKAVEARRKRG